jgi:hypothetical protein
MGQVSGGTEVRRCRKFRIDRRFWRSPDGRLVRWRTAGDGFRSVCQTGIERPYLIGSKSTSLNTKGA